MRWEDRINNYVRETGFPRSLFIAEGGCVVGTWIMGNDYRVRSGYYGGRRLPSPDQSAVPRQATRAAPVQW